MGSSMEPVPLYSSSMMGGGGLGGGGEGLGGDGRFDHRIQWLRDVEVIRLPGRHHLHMDDPRPVADAIKAFLG